MNTHKKLTDKIAHHTHALGVKSLNQLNLPNSLLIIPDGNGRWAKHMGLSIEEGHKVGGITMGKILEAFMDLNIKVVGVWGFSEDNWKRPKAEIDNIMTVVKTTIDQNLEKLKKNHVRFLVLGKKEKIKKEYPKVYNALENAQKETAHFKEKNLVLFLDYGERYQLEEFAREREKDRASSTYDLLSKINNGLPLFDMILRTSGEQRTSGFGPLSSIAEFISVKKNLPELSKSDIALALNEYSGRQRRFGGR